MSAQVETRKTTLDDVIGAESFAAGWREVRAGTPPDYDRYGYDEAWGYERGRAAAVLARADFGRVPPLYDAAMRVDGDVLWLIRKSFVSGALL